MSSEDREARRIIASNRRRNRDPATLNDLRVADANRQRQRREQMSPQALAEMREANRIRTAATREQMPRERVEQDRAVARQRIAAGRRAARQAQQNIARQGVIIEEQYCGPMNNFCTKCNSRNFKAEKSQGGRYLCCEDGKVTLRPVRVNPLIQSLLTGEHDKSKHFKENIRSYNSSLAFASMGAKISPPPGYGPYCFRIHGQIFHSTGALHPNEGIQRSFNQLYILDAEEALATRQGQPSNRELDANLLLELSTLFLDINPLAHSYKMMRAVELEEEHMAIEENREPLKVFMTIVNNLTDDQRRYNAPRCNEVAIVFTSAQGEPPFNRDIVVHPKRTARTQPLSFQHKKCDAMIYPIFHPYADSAWTISLTSAVAVSEEFQSIIGNRLDEVPYDQSRNGKITLLQYYAYRLADRGNFNAFLSGGKLTQQYVVDAYAKIEADRLNYIRKNQAKLRVDTYAGIMDHLHNVAENSASNTRVGVPVILPSSFIGSPRAMQQNFQDAMAIVKRFGKPDLFITMTCNPNWKEITENLKPGQRAEDRPDLTTRVFKLKHEALMEDLTKKHLLGKVLAFIHVIEFQKRGLPHAHMLFILENESKLNDEEKIDAIVSAEIPDIDENATLHNNVIHHMIHGPCGALRPNSVCMSDGKCSKNFPKQCLPNTNKNIDGYPQYRRRCRFQMEKDTYVLDDSWVVPYNPYLIQKYNCHINVEACASIKSVKYLYKYVYKGHDCATIEISTGQPNQVIHDETKNYLDTRYVSGPEAMWRIRKNRMSGSSHTIKRLTVHLEGQQNVYFEEANEEMALVTNKNTTLQAWFQLNARDEHARQYLYTEIPEPYVWVNSIPGHGWGPRRKQFGRTIGRMYTVALASGELYFLRLLLLHVKGATSYSQLRTVDGVCYQSFREAAVAMQLLADDTQWEQCLNDGVLYQMPYQLRQLFATICVYGEPSQPLALFEKFKDELISDFVHRGHGTDSALQLALKDINDSLQSSRKSCADYNLPVPRDDVEDIVPVDLPAILQEAERLQALLNEEQKLAFEAIMSSLNNEAGSKCFFLDGPGGSGKTFLYNCLIKTLQAQGLNASCVASTGLAANLLQGGSTYHSKFGFGVNTNETTTSKIKPSSRQGVELKNCAMVIWDEVTMVPHHLMDATDRLFKDLTGLPDPFGSKIILVGGDFRQILPVVRHGNRSSVVQACVKSSHVWPAFRHLHLHQNMRTAPEEIEFSDWLIKLGNGDLPTLPGFQEDVIEIPRECIEDGDLLTSIYGDVVDLDLGKTSNRKFLSERAILAPKNVNVSEMNEKILDRCTGESNVFYAMDSIDPNSTDGIVDINDYPIEFLNSLTPSGFPPYKLTIKVGCVVMLLRNLNKKRGLCNGTRLFVKSIRRNVILAEIFEGENKGQEVLIPRIDLLSNDTDLPVQFRRRQFPIVLAFVITINKSQGQSLLYLGIYLPLPVFAHGQLYVAFSRGRRKSNVKVKVLQTSKQGRLLLGEDKFFTVNCVYKEIL